MLSVSLEQGIMKFQIFNLEAFLTCLKFLIGSTYQEVASKSIHHNKQYLKAGLNIDLTKLQSHNLIVLNYSNQDEIVAELFN